MDLEKPRHPRKFGKRVGTHLATQSFAMHFNCPLAYSQFRGDLFVQETGRDQCENFALASGQRAEASFDLETLGMLPTPRTRALYPRSIAVSSASSSNGFSRTSTAPALIACTPIDISLRPVMKTIDTKLLRLPELILKFQPIHFR